MPGQAFRLGAQGFHAFGAVGLKAHGGDWARCSRPDQAPGPAEINARPVQIADGETLPVPAEGLFDNAELEMIRAGQIEFRRDPCARPAGQSGKGFPEAGKNAQKPGRAVCGVVKAVPVFPVKDMAGKLSGQQRPLFARAALTRE